MQRSSKQLLVSVLCATSVTAAVCAQGFIIDQSLQPPTFQGGGSQFYHYDAVFASLMPQTGQAFIPSLSALGFVDINLYNAGSNSVGTFQIAIHQGTISGGVLGLSDETVRSEGYPQEDTHFAFSSTIPLIAGDTYVLEVIQLAGSSGWAVEVPVSASVNGQAIDMNYPGGKLIYGGIAQDGKDMIFREGVMAVPEPSVTQLSAFIALLICIARAHISRKRLS